MIKEENSMSLKQKEIIEINQMMEKISKIGKCPNCYFEKRKHELRLMSAIFNFSSTFQCTTCGGIYGVDRVLQTVDMDIRKKK